jgi:hypothetical protein
MSTKVLFQLFMIFSLIGIITLFGATPVLAQCGEPPPSSCVTCHAKEDPISEKGEWHIIHASKDICIDCHGGNATAADKDLAHESLTANPLDDIYTDCHSCHPDYDARAARFAPTLGVTPGSCATPTPIPFANHSSQPPSTGFKLPAATPSSQPFLIISSMLSVLALLIFGVGWLEKHHVQ